MRKNVLSAKKRCCFFGLQSRDLVVEVDVDVDRMFCFSRVFLILRDSVPRRTNKDFDLGEGNVNLVKPRNQFYNVVV